MSNCRPHSPPRTARVRDRARLAKLLKRELGTLIAGVVHRRPEVDGVRAVGEACRVVEDDDAAVAFIDEVESSPRVAPHAERRHALGAITGLSLAQTQSLVESARLDVAAYAAQVEQDRHAVPDPPDARNHGLSGGAAELRVAVHLRRRDLQHLAHAFGCRGPAFNCMTACAASTQAMKLFMSEVPRP